jgi:hypothetical protein
MEMMKKMKYPVGAGPQYFDGAAEDEEGTGGGSAPASLRRACLVQDTIAGFFKKVLLWCMVRKCSEQHQHQAASQSAYGVRPVPFRSNQAVGSSPLAFTADAATRSSVGVGVVVVVVLSLSTATAPLGSARLPDSRKQARPASR